MNMDAKIINKTLADRIEQLIERITYCDEVGYILDTQVCFNM